MPEIYEKVKNKYTICPFPVGTCFKDLNIINNTVVITCCAMILSVCEEYVVVVIDFKEYVRKIAT